MRDIAEAATREVIELHALFVDLFTGRFRDFARCEAAFAPNFEMVTPDGHRLTRREILSGLANVRTDGTFRISIQTIRPVLVTADSVLLQYIEEQYREGQTTRRLSIALFEASQEAPLGVAWRYLQETWIDGV